MTKEDWDMILKKMWSGKMDDKIFDELKAEISREIALIVADCNEEVRSQVLQIIIYSCFGILLSRQDYDALNEISNILQSEILSKH